VEPVSDKHQKGDLPLPCRGFQKIQKVET